MYDGYLELGGVEILNRARAAAYLTSMLPGRVQVVRGDAVLGTALEHAAYTTPAGDSAPWVTGNRVAGGRFLGLFPGSVLGAEDSSRGVEVTELSGDGAVMTSPRYSAVEMRFKATAFATTEEGMDEGMAWLKQALAHDGCSNASLGCTGQEAKLFAGLPSTAAAAKTLTRVFHRVETTEGPKVLAKHPVTSRGFLMWEVEFTLTAGIPWAFTVLNDGSSLNMNSASNFQDPANEDCSVTADAYNSYVDDPFFTGISRPPRPPVILPPNILKITSWRRLSTTLSTSHSLRWGRIVPVVNVSTVEAVQYLRLRFYESNKAGCDFAGEFMVSYIPANSILTLDGIKREATLTLPGGKVVPAGHLLFGSHGRPFIWPSLGCQKTWTMRSDLMPGQTGVVVMVQSAVRL